MSEKPDEMCKKLAKARVELQMAEADFERETAMREAELERNRALEEIGQPPQEVRQAPQPVPEDLIRKVKELESRCDKLGADEVRMDTASEPPVPVTITVEAETSTPRGAANPFQLLLTLLVSLVVLNLPIFFYAAFFHYWPNLVVGALFFALYLGLALVGQTVGEKFLLRDPNASLELVFGLQFVLCFLPSLMLGAGVGSDYVKTNLLSPLPVQAPSIGTGRHFSGYYEFSEAMVQGELWTRGSKTISTKSGDSTTSYRKIVHVAPLVGKDWTPSDEVKFWLTSDDAENRFDHRKAQHSPCRVLALRGDSATDNALDAALTERQLKVSSTPVLVRMISPEEPQKFRSSFFFWLAGLNLIVTAATLFALVKLNSRG